MAKAPRLDPVTAYATQVARGTVVASRLVRQACTRHLEDLKQAKKKGLIWYPDRAQQALDFFPEVLCLPERTDADEAVTVRRDDDDGTPQPFVLSPFQQFIVGSLFGWYTVQGFRRFREAYIETAKGSGKTPLGAGIMLYLLVADGERGAQVFAAAVTRDQARLAFADAEKMVEASPALSEVLESTVNNLAYAEGASFFRAVSSEKRGLDGKRVHGALIDELHEHPAPIVVNKMRAGTKGRRNALIVKITNSGFDRTSVCWHHHEYSRKVLEGTVVNETWFAFIAGLDACESCRDKGHWFPVEDCKQCDRWDVEGPHWLKANPNLGASLPWQYLRERVAQAKGMPSEVGDVLRFNFCVWTQQKARFFDMAKWHACARVVVTDEQLRDAVMVVGGLDMGQSDDFTAFVAEWLLEDGRKVWSARFWLPTSAFEKYPDRPYDDWRRAGLLTEVDGEVIVGDDLEDQLAELANEWGIRDIGYDRRFAQDLASRLEGRGITMVDVRQGFGLNEAIKGIQADIVAGRAVHGGHAILTWMADNAVVRKGRMGEVRLDKESSREKIDGMTALATARMRLIAHAGDVGESLLDQRGGHLTTIGG